MFKKSLAAVAVLGAFAGSALAADVQLYGLVDLGLNWTQVDKGTTTTDSFGMGSGQNSGSRFGLKGTEELGNGLKVGFKLENGFQSDSGALKSEKRIFDREASVSLYSDFGTLSMGRMGGVGSGAGTYDLVLATADAFDGGDNNVFGFATSDRYDNMVTYQTPKFAGLQATVQYSFNEDSVNDKDREGSSAVNRYASAALTGDFGALQTVLAYEFQNYQSFGEGARGEDGHIVYLGGNYDFEVAKVFVMGQYFKGIQGSGANALASMVKGAELKTFDTDFDKGVKGFGAHVGTIVPVAGGDFTGGLYYVDSTVKYAEEDADGKYYGVALKYEYPLSKRTSVYGGTGWYKAKVDYSADDVYKEEGYQAYLGLTHCF